MSATPPDPYDVLGVPPTATPQELGRAYRRLLRSHHPDTSAGDRTSPERQGDGVSLGDVLAAYELLRDPVARAEHDRTRRRTPAPTPTPRRTPVVVVRAEPRGQRGAGHAEPQVRVGTGRPEPQIRVGPVLWRPSR
jgi:curved DNA-binding protein CbpA